MSVALTLSLVSLNKLIHVVLQLSFLVKYSHPDPTCMQVLQSDLITITCFIVVHYKYKKLIIIITCSARYYSATIIRMTGVRDTSLAIWLAAMTAGVNFVFTILGVWLVERIGRRPLILGSLVGKSQPDTSPLSICLYQLHCILHHHN